MTSHPKHTCPAHGTKLVRVQTEYGGRWNCPKQGCTVCCWEGSTSTPADQSTRTLRNRCHRAFDQTWKDPHGIFATDRNGVQRGGTGKRRHRAYLWLSKAVGVKLPDAHFGMFNASQCLKALDEIQALLHDHAEIQP